MEFLKQRDETQPDLRVNIGSLELANPVMTASGTFGYAREFENLMNLHRLGAVIVKGISLHPRAGNPPPRIVETACGMLNAIGLQNVGVDRFISEKMMYLQGLNVPVIVNILGDSLDEYEEIAERLRGVAGVAGIEVNISCPNVKKGGVAFGTDPAMAGSVTAAVKRKADVPVMVKLSPNVTDIGLIARAVEDEGADSISLINTLIGMAIDLKTRRPALANVIGGLSGRHRWHPVSRGCAGVYGCRGHGSSDWDSKFCQPAGKRGGRRWHRRLCVQRKTDLGQIGYRHLADRVSSNLHFS